MSESGKLRHYQVDILYDAKDFNVANDIAQEMLKKSPYPARILTLKQVTLNKDD